MCFSTPATHVLPHFTNLLKPSRHGPKRVWNKDIWVTFRWSDGKKNKYILPTAKNNTCLLGFHHPKLLVQHFPCGEFHLSTSRHFTICAVAWATFCGLPWALAATKPGQSTTSRLGAWHRGWVAWHVRGYVIVPWRVSQSPIYDDVFMVNPGIFVDGYLSVSCIGKKTSRKQMEAQTKQSWLDALLGRNIELRHREKTLSSQSPMWCLIPNGTQFVKIYQVILGKLAGDLDMTCLLSRVTIPALFWKTQFMAYGSHAQSPSSCSVLLICSTLWKIMENNHPFSFYSALRYSLHLLFWSMLLSAISENFSHKDGQHCRNAVEKNRKRLSTGQRELRVFPTKKSPKMKIGFVVTRSLSFYRHPEFMASETISLFEWMTCVFDLGGIDIWLHQTSSLSSALGEFNSTTSNFLVQSPSEGAFGEPTNRGQKVGGRMGGGGLEDHLQWM